MNIQIWSDIVCPFCYLGKRHLELALADLPEIKDVEIVYRSFELDPNAAIYHGVDTIQMLVKKYGMSPEEARENFQRIADSGEAVGLEYNIDLIKNTNTLDAHRLIKYAKTQGKEEKMLHELYYSLFTEGKLISDHKDLTAIATRVGLDPTSVAAMLEDKNAFIQEVREDEALAQRYGIDVVPTFIFNNKYAVSGAQPVEALKDVIQKVYQENQK